MGGAGGGQEQPHCSPAGLGQSWGCRVRAGSHGLSTGTGSRSPGPVPGGRRQHGAAAPAQQSCGPAHLAGLRHLPTEQNRLLLALPRGRAAPRSCTHGWDVAPGAEHWFGQDLIPVEPELGTAELVLLQPRHCLSSRGAGGWEEDVGLSDPRQGSVTHSVAGAAPNPHSLGMEMPH